MVFIRVECKFKRVVQTKDPGAASAIDADDDGRLSGAFDEIASEVLAPYEVRLRSYQV